MERLKQELELGESTRSYKYRRCIRLLDSLLGLLLIKLTPMNTGKSSLIDEEEHIYSRVQVAVIQGSKTQNSTSIWRFFTVRLLFLIAIIYGLAKFLLTSILQISYEQLVGRLMPETCFIINVPQCCIAMNIPKKLERYQARFDQISQWIELIGYPLAFTPVIAPLLVCIITVFMTTAYPINLGVLALSKIYLDVVGFVRNPVETARRHYRELDRITSDLSGSFINRIFNKQCSCKMEGKHETFGTRKADKLLASLFLDHQSESVDFRKKCINKPNKLLGLLRQASREIQPASLDVVWHRKLISWSYCGIRIACLAFCTFAMVFYLSFVYIVMNWSFIRRVETTKCARLGENVRPINYLHMKPLNLSSNVDYRWLDEPSNQGIFSEQSTASFNIMLWYFFTPSKILMFMELGLALVLLTLWYSSIISLFVMAIADKVRWVKQIHNQLNRAMEEQAKEKVNHEKFLNLTLTAYLNYSLFKSEYPRFRPMVNLALCEVLIFTACSVFTLYMISEKNFKLNYLSTFAINVSLIILFTISNGFFAVGSYLFAQTEHTIKQLVRLLTFYNNMSKTDNLDTNVSLEFVMRSWHRHLLDKESLAHAYALSFLGVKVCFEKLLPMNAYSLAVALMMFKY